MIRKRKVIHKPCILTSRLTTEVRQKFDTLKSFYDLKSDTYAIEMIINSQFNQHIDYLVSFDPQNPRIAPLFDYIESIKDKT